MCRLRKGLDSQGGLSGNYTGHQYSDRFVGHGAQHAVPTDCEIVVHGAWIGSVALLCAQGTLVEDQVSIGDFQDVQQWRFSGLVIGVKTATWPFY
jgi:hypothetical protein